MASPYYGSLLHRRVAGPFELTESVFCGGSSLPTHEHQAPYFTFTLRGSYSERYGRQSRLCTAGTAVGHPALETHSQVFGIDAAVLVRIALNGSEAEEAVEAALEAPMYLNNPQVAGLVRKLHRELRGADVFSDAVVEGLAYELIARALQNDSEDGGSRKRALCARAFIRSSLQNRLSLTTIAREIGVSRTTLYRDFKTAFGCGPGEYLREARIKTAASMLRRTPLPVTEIAAWSGFYDQSHFDRCFRRSVGVSPSQYRNDRR